MQQYFVRKYFTARQKFTGSYNSAIADGLENNKNWVWTLMTNISY